jgi:hypothetical protein
MQNEGLLQEKYGHIQMEEMLGLNFQIKSLAPNEDSLASIREVLSIVPNNSRA